MKEKWLDIRLDNFESYGEPTLPIKFMDAKLGKKMFHYWIESNDERSEHVIFTSLLSQLIFRPPILRTIKS